MERDCKYRVVTPYIGNPSGKPVSFNGLMLVVSSWNAPGAWSESAANWAFSSEIHGAEVRCYADAVNSAGEYVPYAEPMRLFTRDGWTMVTPDRWYIVIAREVGS